MSQGNAMICCHSGPAGVVVLGSAHVTHAGLARRRSRSRSTPASFAALATPRGGPRPRRLSYISRAGERRGPSRPRGKEPAARARRRKCCFRLVGAHSLHDSSHAAAVPTAVFRSTQSAPQQGSRAQGCQRLPTTGEAGRSKGRLAAVYMSQRGCRGGTATCLHAVRARGAGGAGGAPRRVHGQCCQLKFLSNSPSPALH